MSKCGHGETTATMLGGSCPYCVAERDRLQSELDQCEREKDSLRLELQGLEHVRRRDNEYLLGEVDRLKADVEPVLRAAEEVCDWWRQSLTGEIVPPLSLLLSRLNEALARQQHPKGSE